MDPFELEADGVNALLGRSEVDLTQTVVEVSYLARVDLSTRRRQRRFHVQRIGAYTTQGNRRHQTPPTDRSAQLSLVSRRSGVVKSSTSFNWLG